MAEGIKVVGNFSVLCPLSFQQKSISINSLSSVLCGYWSSTSVQGGGRKWSRQITVSCNADIGDFLLLISFMSFC